MSKWWQRYIFLFVLTIILFPNVGQAQVSLSAQNSLLMELSTGRVLFDQGAHEKRSIASLTKVMTAIIAIESEQFSDLVTTSRRAIYTPGSSIYLEQGEKMTLEDLTYGLMLRSGNDAAVAIAEHIGGSVEGFVHLMNEKAKWIGMTNTNFVNPHGLEDEGHYSTAYDLALLMRYAMNNDLFREISKTKSYRSQNRTYHWFNKNKLLTQLYEHSTGGKTGFTKKAGRTLITTAKHNNMELIAVTLNAPRDWQDHINLFEWGFNNYEMTLVDDHFFIPKTDLSEREAHLQYEQTFKVYPLNRFERQLIENERQNQLITQKQNDLSFRALVKIAFEKSMQIDQVLQ